MKLNEIDKLKTGEKYNMTVVEDVTFSTDGKEVKVVAEYRGLDIYEGYLIFEEEGKSRMSTFHYSDIKSCKVC